MTVMQAAWRRRCAVLAVAVLLAACQASPPPFGGRGADALFHADPRWLGGDAAISVPLGHGRVLWLFGDSFVDLEAPYRRSEAAFPRNTVAVQTGLDPAAATMQFAWAGAPGKPASFFADDGADWFWPGAGIRIAGGPLVIFLHRTALTDAAPPLNFRTTGYAILLVDNPDDPPAAWRRRRIDGPALAFDAVPGAAALVDGADLVVLALRQGQGQGQDGLLVRYGLAALARGDLRGARWWTGRAWAPADEVGPEGPAVVIAQAGAEASLHRDACGRIVHVASRGFGATDIAVRLASRVEGPWSDPVAIVRPAESRDPAAFVYAGKGHDEQAGDAQAGGGLMLTYVASSFRPGDLLSPEGQSDLYWPRVTWVRIPGCRS